MQLTFCRTKNSKGMKMKAYSFFNGQGITEYLLYTICVLVIIFASGCGGSDTSQSGTSDDITADASEMGSASFSVKWHTRAADTDPAANTVSISAIASCSTEGVEVITCEVYDDNNNPIASGGPWPCDARTGRIERIPAGPGRVFAVLGWNSSGGEIIYQGNSASRVDIAPGEIADAGTIDANPFVPTGPGAQAFSDSRIDLVWDDQGAGGYRIYRNGTEIATSNLPSFSDTNLGANTQYCYTVAAYDVFGNESGPSGQACATTPESFDWYGDGDGDGYGDPNDPVNSQTQPDGYVDDNTDCNDGDASINPAAAETCNGVDDDCDGSTDEEVQNTYYRDSDGDGYGNPNDSTQACSAPADYVTDSTDCNDADAAINPGAQEIFDGIDNDCDGSIDEDLNTYYRDSDRDGYGNINDSTQAASPPEMLSRSSGSSSRS